MIIVNLVPEAKKEKNQLRPRKAINFLKIAQQNKKIRRIAIEVSFEKLQKSLQRKNRNPKVFLLPDCKAGRIYAEYIKSNIKGSKIVFVKFTKTKKHRKTEF